jgi:hypothetical protein
MLTVNSETSSLEIGSSISIIIKIIITIINNNKYHKILIVRILIPETNMGIFKGLFFNSGAGKPISFVQPLAESKFPCSRIASENS